MKISHLGLLLAAMVLLLADMAKGQTTDTTKKTGKKSKQYRPVKSKPTVPVSPAATGSAPSSADIHTRPVKPSAANVPGTAGSPLKTSHLKSAPVQTKKQVKKDTIHHKL